MGPDIESFNIVSIVDEYRQYWKPDNVRVVLLAESHVYTTEKEHHSALDTSKLGLPGYPDNFVRFVYCLGYGDNNLLTESINNNPGSRSFWKIFYSTCNSVKTHDDFSPVMKTKSLDNTISNRITLLREMKEAGIWLVDASIIGINAEHRPPPIVYRELLLRCWDFYIQELISRTYPNEIIIIGKEVGKVLEDRVRRIISHKPAIFSLPSKYLKKDQSIDMFRKINEICNHIPFDQKNFSITPEEKDLNLKTTHKIKIRAQALEWGMKKFGNRLTPMYCSKHYESHKSWTGAKAWWIKVPDRFMRENGQIYFLLQKNPDGNDFYCLKVPAVYLRENEKGLAKLGGSINLFLSAENGDLFQDKNGKGKVEFRQFMVMS